MRVLAIILALVLAGCVTVNVQLDCDTISPSVRDAVEQNLGD